MEERVGVDRTRASWSVTISNNAIIGYSPRSPPPSCSSNNATIGYSPDDFNNTPIISVDFLRRVVGESSCKIFAETYMNYLLILFWILSEIFLNSISEIWLKLEHSRQISESAEQKISKNFSNISVFFQQIIQFWNLSEFGTFQTVFRIQQSSENFPAITQQCFSSI